MKIRTDFVTNSSSSSFVTYKLRDSELCRFIYDKMQEKGLSYEARSSERPASSVHFDRDSLNADISCRQEGLYCERYAPEVIEPEMPYFDTLLSDLFEHFDDFEDEVPFYIYDDFEEASDNEYVFRGNDDTDCQEIYDYFCTHSHDDAITEENGCFRCKVTDICQNPPFDVSFEFYPDRITARAENAGAPEYGGSYKESDIRDMTRSFLDVIGDFLPLEELGSDKEELKKLFEKDKASGRFECDVYMGSTD